MNVKQLRNRWGVMLLLCITVGISTALAGPTTFVSDDFNAYNLKRPLWTLVDPKNDCTLNLQGVNSGSARLFLTTPAGTTHDIWSDGNTAPRILQNCANEDFTVETKFLSSVTGVSFSRYQAEGILVQADENNFIRFDFTTGNNDSTTAFAAAFIGGIANPQVKISKGIGPYGIAPLYLRVNRTGNVWTMMVSRDGNTFDSAGSFAQPLAVSKIGLYAINAGTTPQSLTMIADYFWNMDNSLASQDAATNVTDTQGPLVYAVRYKPAPDAIQVSWKTDEAANGTVDYGTTTAYGQTVTQSTFTTDHILTAFGLSANTLYHLRIAGTDGSGHSDNSGDLTATSTDYYVDSTSVSDDFNAPSLDAGLWATVNPRGDAAFAIDAKQLSIAVPGGIVHEIYTAGNTAPRVVQTVNSTSNVREWILKFNSIPAGTGGANTSYPMQGLYLEQDSINVMRFDIWSDGNNVMVFVASFTDGFANVESHVNTTIPYNAAPIWLKVVQGGASWHVYYSSNGTSWVQAWGGYHVMNVRKAGPYAGNSGSAPQAFTALVDYFQAALPSKPFLTAPTAGQANVIRPVAFSWDTATGASLYRMQVSTNSGFTSTVFDSTFASTSRYVSVLNPTSQYYWRVRGVNGTLNGPYSAGQSFTTAVGSPAAPSLVSPADNVTGITITPTMIWTKSAGATSYRLQIGTDSTFATQLAVNDSTITDTVFTTPALAYNARYFWRVAAKNAGGYSAFTTMRRFTTRLATPPVPVLLSPAKGAVDQPVSLTLSWNASEGAVAYWIQVDTDTLFTAPYVMEDTAVTTTSSAVSGLAHSTGYYWRVRAKNAGGASAASEIWNFTTVVAPPAQPVLLSPVDGATGQLSSLLMVWTRPAGATTFRLQVGTDSTFLTGVFFNDSTLTDTLGLVSSLAYGQKYYWKVSAKNAGGTGPSSAIFSFFTLASDPTVPVQIAPANGSTTTESSVTLRWTAPVGASSFHLQVATDPTFATGTVLDDPAVLDTSRTINGLVYMTTYYWRVNADNVGGVSPWSPTFSFQVRVPLPARVQAFAPANGITTSADSTLTVWNTSAPLVDRYQIDLAADSLFTFKVSDSTVTDTVKMYHALINGQRYYWRVRAHNASGWGPFSVPISFTASSLVSVEKQRELPTTISLSQNYPNPFNPSTQIEFALPKEGHVTLEVYNLLGERVATLVNESMSVGYHTVRFDASHLSSGLYLYRMVAGSTTIVHKMMLVK